jgi:hypothetical protein
MKYLFILLLSVSVSVQGQVRNFYSASTNGDVKKERARQDSIQKSQDAICAERCHMFEEVREDRQKYIFGYHATWYMSDFTSSDTCRTFLVDTPDSSYIVRRELPEVKYCYRCGRTVEFPRPEVYIKTVWRR